MCIIIFEVIAMRGPETHCRPKNGLLNIPTPRCRWPPPLPKHWLKKKRLLHHDAGGHAQTQVRQIVSGFCSNRQPPLLRIHAKIVSFGVTGFALFAFVRRISYAAFTTLMAIHARIRALGVDAKLAGRTHWNVVETLVNVLTTEFWMIEPSIRTNFATFGRSIAAVPLTTSVTFHANIIFTVRE